MLRLQLHHNIITHPSHPGVARAKASARTRSPLRANPDNCHPRKVSTRIATAHRRILGKPRLHPRGDAGVVHILADGGLITADRAAGNGQGQQSGQGEGGGRVRRMVGSGESRRENAPPIGWRGRGVECVGWGRFTVVCLLIPFHIVLQQLTSETQLGLPERHINVTEPSFRGTNVLAPGLPSAFRPWRETFQLQSAQTVSSGFKSSADGIQEFDAVKPIRPSSNSIGSVDHRRSKQTVGIDHQAFEGR